MFDKNHDGKISSEELGCVIRTLGHNHSSKEIEEMIKNVDTNGKSIISGRGLSKYQPLFQINFIYSTDFT